MDFKEFLTKRGHTQAEVDKMEGDALTKLHTDFQVELNKELADQIAEATANKATKEEVKTMVADALKAIGENAAFKDLNQRVLDLQEGGGIVLAKTEKQQIYKFIKDNASEIKKIHSAGAGMIEFTTKVVGDMTTGSATLPTAAPQLVGTQDAPAGNINLKTTFIDELITTFETDLASYPYTESEPKDGDFNFVAEGAIKPQTDFKITTRWAAPVKIAAHTILTDESIQDIRGLQSIATDYLLKKHNLKRQNGILFGDGISPNPKGATVFGRAFVAGSMALEVTTPNIMDIINAAIVDIFTTHNYQDEEPYQASIALLNPIDFYLKFVAAKQPNNGLPLFPTAGLFNKVVIGGVTIIPKEEIPIGKLFVSDLSKYNVTNYVGYTVKMGFINDQLITNKFTMVGESRLHAFVKRLDEKAFIFDDILTIETAIKKP